MSEAGVAAAPAAGVAAAPAPAAGVGVVGTPAAGVPAAGAEIKVTPSTANIVTPPPATPPPGTATPPEGIHWTTGLTPDAKAYVENKGYKDAGALLESYRNLEKLNGVPSDRLLKLPETADSADWASVHKALGKPESPDGYGLQVDEGADPAFTNWAKDAFHSINLSKDQSDGLLAKFNDFSAGQEAEQADARKQETAARELELKKDWGAAYHQNIASAQRAAKEFGIPGDAIDALEATMGFDGVMKFMHNLGTKVGEHGYISGNPISGFGDSAILTPEQAKAQLANIKKDPAFTAKYLSGDVDAKAKMKRLHQMAYADD